VVAKVAKNVKEDIRNFDIGNTSEEKALQSHYFSIYKGAPVVRWTPDGRTGSFGALFLDPSLNNEEGAIDTEKHEWGHTVQLKKLGVTKYVAGVMIPSYLSNDNPDYYSTPWDVMADVHGGVDRTGTPYEHKKGAEATGAIYEMLLMLI
jgi:hypothetical protein